MIVIKICACLLKFAGYEKGRNINMRILAEETMALIVDIQEKLIPVIKDKEDCIRNVKLLLEGFTLLQIPFIVTQQYTKGLGMTIPEIRDRVDNFQYLDKISFSCYEDRRIKEEIDKLKKKNIILCGAEAHICVQQTAVDLRAAGYNVIAVTNCIGSRKAEDKEAALKRYEYEGIINATYESILFELTRKAGSDTFKAISALIK